MTWRGKGLGLLLGAALAGCAGMDEGSADGFDPHPGGEGSANTGSNGADGTGASGTHQNDGQGPDDLPPEQEEVLTLEVPSAGRTSVYVPNPVTHRVAVVNAQTLVVESLASGLSPTYVATVPGQDLALVLNLGTRDASLLRTTDGKTTVTQLDVGHDQNAVAVAPDGKHAIIYFDARRADGLAETYQEVTVVRLEAGKERSRGVSVGFRPKSVRFSRDAGRAFVVTEDGVSIVDLGAADAGPVIARTVAVGDSVSDAVSSDVQVTADGRFALARREGDSGIRLVDLDSGSIETLPLASIPSLAAEVDIPAPDAGASSDDAGSPDAGPGPASPALALTDLDLAPDGKTAYGVVRSVGALLQIPIPEAFSDPALVQVRFIEDQVVGSVVLAKSGTLAALYTTASPVEGLVLVDLGEAPAMRSVRLRKAVRAVALSDDGSRALVLHTAETNARSDEDARIDASEGYSLINTETGFAKLELTPARIREHQLVLTPDARRLFMLLRADAEGVRALQMADLESFQVRTEPLAQPPLSLGLLPGLSRVFVGEENPGGRITFFDEETGGLVAAMTGFEIASRIAQ